MLNGSSDLRAVVSRKVLRARYLGIHFVRELIHKHMKFRLTCEALFVVNSLSLGILSRVVISSVSYSIITSRNVSTAGVLHNRYARPLYRWHRLYVPLYS